MVCRYNGGFAQHIMLMNNSIEQIWGGDREVITYDNAGGAYFGRLAHVDPASPNITTLDPRIPVNRSSGSSSTTPGGGWVVEGGALVVLNGSGSGQVRRIVVAADAAAPFEWVLDSPLQGIDTDTFVQILPFRGRNIFYRNRLSDVGALQFYGIGLENIVSENTLERMAGLVSWGQWRGYHSASPAPPPESPSHVKEPALSQTDRSRDREMGEMGCGANVSPQAQLQMVDASACSLVPLRAHLCVRTACTVVMHRVWFQPNLFNVFERNTFVEGNTIVNYNTPEGASYNFGGGYLLTSTSGGGAG